MQQTDDFLLELYMQRFTTIEKKKKKKQCSKIKEKESIFIFLLYNHPTTNPGAAYFPK